jgi:hypothetical protein
MNQLRMLKVKLKKVHPSNNEQNEFNRSLSNTLDYSNITG